MRQLALDTNRAAGSPADAVQLEAAVYMHDVGMMFLPEAVWLKVGNMSDRERGMLHTHPGFGADLLERMESWKAAAEMVRQHHETPDGAGYPARLRGDAICPGAKLLAIADAFEAVMLLAQATGEVLAGGSSFRAQIMDLGIREDRRDRFIFHGKPVNQLNGFVTAFNPWNWREPHHFDAGHPISLRVVNLSTLGANTVNISIFGYSD